MTTVLVVNSCSIEIAGSIVQLVRRSSRVDQGTGCTRVVSGTTQVTREDVSAFFRTFETPVVDTKPKRKKAQWKDETRGRRP